jgi:hypothetical protein
MAEFTAVLVRLFRKLGCVNVLMAGGTGEILDAINHHGVVRFVAFGALNFRVALLQGKSGLVVLRHPKCSGFKAPDSVARITIIASGACGELTVVWVFLVAVVAGCKCGGPIKISVWMAGAAAISACLPSRG